MTAFGRFLRGRRCCRIWGQVPSFQLSWIVQYHHDRGRMAKRNIVTVSIWTGREFHIGVYNCIHWPRMVYKNWIFLYFIFFFYSFDMVDEFFFLTLYVPRLFSKIIRRRCDDPHVIHASPPAFLIFSVKKERKKRQLELFYTIIVLWRRMNKFSYRNVTAFFRDLASSSTAQFHGADVLNQQKRQRRS